VNSSPGNVLIADIRDRMGSPKAGIAARPVNGYVVHSRGLRIANVTVTRLNSADVAAPAAKADPTGFYFFPTTGV
jgi:hypothetical protein